MKQLDLREMSTEQLVDHFAEIGVAQDKTLFEEDIAEFNRLYGQKKAIEEELRHRDGDQRHALLKLYGHSSIQVRLNAANATLAIAPEQARGMLQKIAESNSFPQAGDAGMALWNLDRGVYRPS
jgi:hypothetical protein